ncbi:FecCD family ABC transporter permease [Flavonifractor hominis]|uniref:Iron ABC transporter permease n=1 Tax=Flavonifractor hominis TaxID=3133178 RepID=A0ABV1ESD4_9FIRM
MKRIRSSPPGVLCLLAAVLAGLFLVSFYLGRYGVDVFTTCRILLSPLLGEGNWTANEYTAVINVRLPRILLACLVGCCLASAGAAYQGVFQNPMASPDVLGASSGAAFGAALAILLGLGNSGVTLSAFFWSLVTVAVVYLIGQRAPGERVLNLVLSGMIISSLFTAATSYLKLVADPTNQLPEITYWLMGSLSGTRLRDVLYILPVMALGLVPLFFLRWKLNLLTLGDDEARTMGVNAPRLRLGVVLCATLVTAASISVSGMIGWVGLVVPHLCRKLVGSNFKWLLPCAMLAGAAFLLLVDDISRNLLATEIPIGILTAFTGAPFFLYLMMRKGENN